jgi:hypothetical protein
VGLAPEDSLVEAVIRQFLFGRKPDVFRVLFTIEDDQVRLLTIRRAQRRLLTRKPLREVLRSDEEESSSL